MLDRLFEAIVHANHQALAGNAAACVHRTDFEAALPIAALTCIDPRLNRFFPGVLGIVEEDFIWLRNAGNIIFDPLSSMTRSISLACAIKGAKEIAVIGHTDCRIGKMSIGELTDRFKRLGIERSKLPENLTDYFGMFASETQNVIKGTAFLRGSPLISAKTPVHGLVVDINSGRLDWVVNGYQAFAESSAPVPAPVSPEQETSEFRKDWPAFARSDLKFPETKIGDFTVGSLTVQETISGEIGAIQFTASPKAAAPSATQPPVMPSKPPLARPIPPPLTPPVFGLKRGDHRNPKRR